MTISDKYDRLVALIKADPMLDVKSISPEVAFDIKLNVLQQEMQRAPNVAVVESIIDRWIANRAPKKPIVKNQPRWGISPEYSTDRRN